ERDLRVRLAGELRAGRPDTRAQHAGLRVADLTAGAIERRAKAGTGLDGARWDEARQPGADRRAADRVELLEANDGQLAQQLHARLQAAEACSARLGLRRDVVGVDRLCGQGCAGTGSTGTRPRIGRAIVRGV